MQSDIKCLEMFNLLVCLCEYVEMSSNVILKLLQWHFVIAWCKHILN